MALRPRMRFHQRRGVTRLSGPLVEPVTATELAAHLRTDPIEEVYLSTLIPVAREIVEETAAVAFVSQQWRMTLDSWPGYSNEPWWDGEEQMPIQELYGGRDGKRAVELPRWPLRTVDSVRVFNLDDVPVDVNVDETFTIDPDNRPGRIVLRYGRTWPVALRAANAVEITWTAGFGDDAAASPAMLKRAVMVLAAWMYENRGDCESPEALRASGAAAILDKYRPRRI